MNKLDFIKFMVDCKVLKFGDFTLKSGRKAPYFINTGEFCKGAHLNTLGEFYADCIIENNLEVNTVFGPAYKGIPLAVATAMSLYRKYNIDAGYSFDRKEEKNHGEGGTLVGKKLQDKEKIVITEDVITAGTALRQVLPAIQNVAAVQISGIIVSVDRMEKGAGNISAIQQIKEDYGIDVYPIITILDIIQAIKDDEIPGKEYLNLIENYREIYGV